MENNIKSESNVERQCANCATTTTPLWRKYGSCHFLCNACGLYYRVNGDHRPHVSKISRVSTLRRSFLQCANCGTNKTTMWRRDAGGVHVCNACGLFYRINGFNRPVSMRRDVIRTRKRREKELILAQHQSLDDDNQSMEKSPINLSSNGTNKTQDVTVSTSLSSNESCSYNYPEVNNDNWIPHDVNPLAYIFTESMSYLNADPSAVG